MPSPQTRRSSPSGSRISRRSPGFRSRSDRSPERRRRMAPPSSGTKYAPAGRGSSPSRGRERREFRHSVRRRSRSPVQRVETKSRAFTPPKRKHSPKREHEREVPHPRSQERDRTARAAIPAHKRSRSKSPPGPVISQRESASRMAGYGTHSGGPPEISSSSRGYQGPSSSYSHGGPEIGSEHTGRIIAPIVERFEGSRSSSFDKERAERPVFRGPEGAGINIKELKRIRVDIQRNMSSTMAPIERNIINPESVVVVRRPELIKGDYTMMLHHYDNGRRSAGGRASPWEDEGENQYVRAINKREGSRPIFRRDEIIQAHAEAERAKYESGYETRIEEHRRVVPIVADTMPAPGSSRYESPERYAEAPTRSREMYTSHVAESYSRSSRDYERAPQVYEKNREERYERRSEDLRHELDMRRIDEKRYPESTSRSYERPREYRTEPERGSSDLRSRIVEKRHDDREHRGVPERSRMEDRRPMMQPSPPGSDRRRGTMEGPNHMEVEPRPKTSRSMQHSSSSMVVPSERYHHKPTEFVSQRPENRFQVKSWEVDPEYVPKGRAYFEHDNREDEMMRIPTRGRGIQGPRGMMYRGRGFSRGRPFIRGASSSRGFMPIRGMSRRGGYMPRGRFFNTY